MNLYKHFLICISLLLFFSCKKEDAVKWQLKEDVLSYYKDSVPNKDKYNAALFLLENMDVHYSPRNEAIDSFYIFMDSIYSLPVQGNGFYHNMYNKAHERYGWDMAMNQINVPDTGAVTARYLIENIDEAYSMWKSWWADEYGFDHFCNYVLPYRMGHEPLSDWRGKYMKQQHPRVERFINYQDNRFNMYGAYAVVNQGMHTAIYYPKGFMPEFPADKLDRLRVGSCQSFADLNVARFRSIGIPVAKDFVPQWGNCRMGHEWVVLLPNEEQCFPFGPNEDLGWHFFGRSENTLPKAFRQMYAKQQELLPLMGSGEPLPPLFQSPTIMDVTDTYTTTTDATVRLFDTPLVRERQYLYAAVFDNRNWQIVHWGKRHGQQVTFTNLGRQVVYLPMAYTQYDEMVPVGHPFLVTAEGEVRPIVADTANCETVRLIRKYRFTYWLNQLCQRTEGGRFQVANKEDFSDSVTIAAIGKVKESRFHSLPTTCDTTYRYFRYLSPDGSYGNMAEVEMYDSLGNRPTIKRMFGINHASGRYRLENMFDGNVLSFYDHSLGDGGWAAVEFDWPQHISEVRFLPRNDDNFIREGEQYELYYWDGRQFASIARMEGNREGVLYVDSVPSHALLLLRNHTKGQEERIFTYENGEQVWW